MNKKSGHWTNTGMAKFINDNLYNYKSDDEKSMNPFRWYRLQNGDDVSKYRETINGFPCRLILVNDGESPLNEGQNEPTPGNTKDMGIFNFNNDKDNVTTLGFNSDIFPNCASYEVTANSDTSAGAFMSFGISHIKVGMVEWRDYTNLIASNHFRTKMTNTGDTTLVNVHFYRDDGFILGTVYEVLPGVSVEIPEGTTKFRLGINGKTFNINNILIEVTDNYYDDGNESLPTHYEIVEDPQAELDYIKQSFELRHPDADDVAEDWGYMGVETEIAIPTLEYTSDSTTVTEPTIITDKIPLSSYSFPTSESSIINIVRVYYYNADLEQVSYWDSRGGSFEANLTDDTEYIAFAIICRQPSNDTLENVLANSDISIGVPIKLVRTDSLSNKMIYDTIEIQKAEGTGLKALIDWVDNCTDEEFVRDFEQHFHKDYTLRYFCLVTLIGAVDNLGKNMMLDTADNKIYFPRFYDID